MWAAGALWLIWSAWQTNLIKMDAVCPRGQEPWPAQMARAPDSLQALPEQVASAGSHWGKSQEGLGACAALGGVEGVWPCPPGPATRQAHALLLSPSSLHLPHNVQQCDTHNKPHTRLCYHRRTHSTNTPITHHPPTEGREHQSWISDARGTSGKQSDSPKS